MALTSFTLRKQTAGYGSNLRKNAATDTSIRADGVSTAVNTNVSATGLSTFSANVLNAETIRLEWLLAEPLVFESSTVGASVYAPVELLIVSSTTGEPVTIRDGSTVTSVLASTPYTKFDDQPQTVPGRWVYYSLFVKYKADVDYWYKREATLYIQLPTQYNSVGTLWEHIPEYYRDMDGQQAKLSGGYTPLYAFLELFGTELDRTRTLIDSVAISNDPNIAVTPALEQLAFQTGLEIGLTELGTSKARALLNNIGTLRQQKGTVSNIISYISGMSGCGASYQYNPGASFSHIFHVNAQRINFISDPTFRQTAGSTSGDTVGGYARTRTLTATWNIVTSANTSLPGSTPYLTINQTTDGFNLTLASSWGSTPVTVRVFPNKVYPYDALQTYYCSFDTAASAGASFNAIHTMTASKMNNLTSPSAPSNLFTTDLYQDTSWANVSVMPSDSNQRRVFEYAPQSGASASGLQSVVPVLEFKMIGGSTIHVGRWLWEPAYLGEYFDGNTRDGGYIPSTSGTSGDGVFDYFWGDGGKNADYSYYLLDRQRTIKTTERVLGQYVIPVTMINRYTLDWNYYPGK